MQSYDRNKTPEELMDEGYRLIDLIPRNQARGFASGIYDQLENIIDIKLVPVLGCYDVYAKTRKEAVK